MIAPTLTQIVIVACGFGVVGLYMLIAHAIVKSSEKDSDSNPHAKPH